MSRKLITFSSIVILSLLLIGMLGVAYAAPLGQPKLAPLADLPGWDYQASLEVQNNASVVLVSGYTVTFTLNTAGLIGQGRLLSDCSDLRITFNGGAEMELDRLVSGCNTSATQIQFRTQADIAASATDPRYTLYYGNASAEAPLSNPANVYAFYDDFQDGDASGWTVTKGTWGVVNEAGNNVYRYTDGGANWPLSYASVPLSDLDYTARIRATDSPKTNWIGLAFRILDPSTLPDFLTFYQSRDTNNFKYGVISNDNHSNPITNPAFTMTAGAWYRLRLQAVGNMVRARIWLDGSAEPSSWPISTTTITYQSSTNIGLTLYNHTTIADWDDIQVRRLVAIEPSVNLGAASWWNNAWGYRRQVTVTNTSASTALPNRYTASFTLDTAAMIGSGQLLDNCSDLRVVYDPGLAAAEIDRVVENCNTNQTTVWFALQRPVNASSQDKAYFLYFGNAAASAPPANGMNVFLFFEDWEQGTIHWTNAGGLDVTNNGTMGSSVVSTDAAVSPTQSQKFSSYGAAGDAFSGYIPVSSSTGYTISTWGRSPNTNVCMPVGFDPYTSTFVKGTENWLWTDEWRLDSQWVMRTASFTTAGTTAYIKIKSEVWDLCSSPGAPPAYLDNLALRYSIGSEPILVFGNEESTLPSPTIANITDTSPVGLGSAIQVSADIASPEGTINSATLRILSPQIVDVPMPLISGTTASGTWQASFTPAQGGTYTYRILAIASTGRSKLSEQHTFTVSDSAPPSITLVSIINPILIRNTQTLVVEVTDNGQLSTVGVTVGGATHPMTAIGNNQYSYSWQVATAGTIPYTVNATDSSNNPATFNGSFVSQPRDVDVCTWKDCRQGAASWSIDDGNNSCLANLTAAGIHGTFFYSGNLTPEWFATYSAAGHEIASHTVNHPCNTPSCSPTCTPETLAAIPVDPAVVTAYRQNQIEPNIAAIEAGTGRPVISLAWPCGCTDPSREVAASYTVIGARGYYDYIAQLTWLEDVNLPTPVNMYNLNTAHSYRQDFVDQAYTEGKWSTTTSHGDCSGIDYLGQQNANGHLWVATIGEVLEYIKVRDASQFSNYSRAGRTISFDAVHTLSPFLRQKVDGSFFPPVIYNNLVTLKVHILDTDTVSNVIVDGVPVTYAMQNLDGVSYVTFDTALNTSRHVVVSLAAPAPAISAVTATNPVELGSQALVSATVLPAEGTTLGTVTLRVLSPETNDYPMSVVSGDQYSASFTPAQLGVYTYQVMATNTESGSSQSSPASFTVVDTTPPVSQAQSQSYDRIAVGYPNILSAQGRDPGGLARAILSTNESGSWQDFDWPVSDWWNHSWAHRRAVTVTEAAGLARTNETVDLLVSSDTFTGLTSCANELRVADQARNELPVQIYAEQVNGGVRTCHLLFQAMVGANASRTYYVYYGNPTAVAPTYTTDLSVTSAGNLRTIQNSFFNLDLDLAYGIVTRVRLPLGSNTNLPLSNSSNHYWGWHQVCSTAHGNITGKNSMCVGRPEDATGLTFVETLAGPLVSEYTLTSEKPLPENPTAIYTIKFRFFANSPYYQYSIVATQTPAGVMNDFWYVTGAFSRLGTGTGGTPTTTYNTYDFSNDHVRIASFEPLEVGSIQGSDNDGTDLGGLNYFEPTHPNHKQHLSLSVVTGADQTATEGLLAKINTPLTSSAFGVAENAPTGQYGSPMELTPGTDWTTTSFSWQNPAIVDKMVSWRINYCDKSNNCSYTPTMSFQVNPTGVPILPASFYGEIHFNEDPPVIGATIEAWVNGMSTPAATTLVQGNPLSYLIDVPGDDPGTTQIEGGVEGSTVTFMLGGRSIATASWHTGTHTQVDLNSFALHLQPGWNLVSFNLHPANTAPEYVLASIAGSYDLVYTWNAASQSWLSFDDLESTSDTLTSMDEKTGFWIHIRSGTPVLYVTGSIPTTTLITLSSTGSGWNLVGFPSASAKALPEVLSTNGVGTAYSLVYTYQAGYADPWLMFDRLAPSWVNDLSTLSPGWGYWVQVTAPVIWSVPYP
jgi:hypothetical protein